MEASLFSPLELGFPGHWFGVRSLSADDLTSILHYHVDPSHYFENDLEGGQVLQTLGGRNLTITIRSRGLIFVNGARTFGVDGRLLLSW